MSTLAIVLAGGESARMGTDKHLLTLPDGRTFTDAVVDVLATFPIDILIVGHARGFVPKLRVPHVDDERPGIGPLGGIATGLTKADDEWTRLLVVTCDAPLVPRARLAELLAIDAPAAAFVDDGGKLLPLPCVLDVAHARAALPQALAQGAFGVGSFLRTLGLVTRPLDDADRALIVGVNTREELAALLSKSSLS
jgi:molybdopterin-guanine dinucleotide biosynthesis protein A